MVNKTKVGLFMLLSAFLFAYIFITMITDNFVIAAPVVKNVFTLLPNAFWDSELKSYAWGALIISITVSGLACYFLDALEAKNEPRIIRGARVVTGAVLAKQTIGK